MDRNFQQQFEFGGATNLGQGLYSAVPQILGVSRAVALNARCSMHRDNFSHDVFKGSGGTLQSKSAHSEPIAMEAIRLQVVRGPSRSQLFTVIFCVWAPAALVRLTFSTPSL